MRDACYILEKEEEDIWLNLDIDEASQLRPLLKPFPDDKLEEWEVEAKARNPRNDYPEIIELLKINKQRTNNEDCFKHLNDDPHIK